MSLARKVEGRGRMNGLHHVARRTAAIGTLLLVTGAPLVLAGCQKSDAPKGQVLATVRGQDVTVQDVRAEGRASGVAASAGPQADAALLESVLARRVLAQSAKDQKLDQTPTGPSDLARLQQTWLAEKAVGKLLAGAPAPTEAQADAFIASHPYAFGQRQRVTAKTIMIDSAPGLMKTLQSFQTYDQAYAFLKRLGVPMNAGVGQVDTAQLPDAAAQKLVGTPVGALIISEPAGKIQISEVQAHLPTIAKPEEQKAFAKRSLAGEMVNSRVGAEVKRLREQYKVTYQPGYGPGAGKGQASKPA